MALTTIPSELSSVSGISDSSTSTAITIDSSQNVTFAGNITTGSNTISGVLSSVTGSLGSAATATTQAASDNSTKLATTAYVTTALANMVDSAPSTLNTLNELAAALGDDANFSTTVTNNIATKLPLAGGTLTGDLLVSVAAGNPSLTLKTAGAGNNPHINYRAGNSIVFDTMLVASAATDYWRVGYGASGSVTSEFLAVTSAGDVGIGTNSPTTFSGFLTVHQKNASGNAIHLVETAGGVISQTISTDGAGGRVLIGARSNHPTIFTQNDTERMRIDSSGRVGIGVSDPSTALDVNGVINVRTSGFQFGRITTNNTSASDGGLTFQTVSGGSFSEAMRIDSSGNVLVGRSSGPYTDGNNVRLHVEGPLPAADGRGQMAIATTAAYNATDRKAMLNFSGAYDTGALPTFLAGIAGEKENTTNSNYGGALTLHTRPNGGALAERMRIDSNGKIFMTEGVPFSWADSSQNVAAEIYGDSSDNLIFRNTSAKTERMRIDSSGNVLVGRTNPSFGNTGHILAPSGFVYHERDGGDSVMYLNRLTSDGDIIRFYKDSSTQVGSIGSYVGTHLRIGSGTANVLFVNNTGILPSTSSGAASDGLIDLGDSGRRFKDLYLSGKAQADTYQFAQNSSASGATEAIYRPTTGSIAFKSNSSERMRIDSSGNVLVGKTSQVSAGRFGVQYDSGQHGIGIDQDFSGAGTLINFLVQNGAVGSVQTNGTATTYNTTSDQRLKENIVDAPSASDDIDAIQVRSFDWKVDGSHQKYGMVAQELQNVAPEAVSAPEDPEEMMGVDYSKLVPMLVKEIQALRTRVQELENN
jgi:hypothetical protein